MGDGFERRQTVELRADLEGRRISGTAVRYGDTATLPWGGNGSRLGRSLICRTSAWTFNTTGGVSSHERARGWR